MRACCARVHVSAPPRQRLKMSTASVRRALKGNRQTKRERFDVSGGNISRLHTNTARREGGDRRRSLIGHIWGGEDRNFSD